MSYWEVFKDLEEEQDAPSTTKNSKQLRNASGVRSARTRSHVSSRVKFFDWDGISLRDGQ